MFTVTDMRICSEDYFGDISANFGLIFISNVIDLDFRYTDIGTSQIIDNLLSKLSVK